MSIKIVTDSTANLPKEIIKEYGIEIIPLKVTLGVNEYRDGIDIAPAQFYELLRTTKLFPKTSPPTVGEFLQTYRKLIREGAKEIISFHLSEKLSETVKAAREAAGMIPDAKITVIDSKSCTMGLGFLPLNAARMVRAGESGEKILEWVEATIPRIKAVFTATTLEYLERGGRLGKAQTFLGSILDLKPILIMQLGHGEIEPIIRVRGLDSATEKIAQIAAEHIENLGEAKGIAILHTSMPKEANALMDKIWHYRIKGEIKVVELFMDELSIVLGSHMGPWAYGVCIY